MWRYLPVLIVTSCWTGDVANPVEPPHRTASKVSRCTPKIVHRHTAVTLSNGQASGFVGVSFGMCDDMNVIAIGDGLVNSVWDNGDPARGASIDVVHRHRGGSYHFIYENVTDVRVLPNDRIVRGQVLATARRGTDDSMWMPTVHLRYMNSRVRFEAWDPLQLLSGCLSRARAGDLVYPIQC